MTTVTDPRAAETTLRRLQLAGTPETTGVELLVPVFLWFVFGGREATGVAGSTVLVPAGSRGTVVAVHGGERPTTSSSPRPWPG